MKKNIAHSSKPTVTIAVDEAIFDGMRKKHHDEMQPRIAQFDALVDHYLEQGITDVREIAVRITQQGGSPVTLEKMPVSEDELLDFFSKSPTEDTENA